MRLLRSVPMSTLSLACSKSSMVTDSRLTRAATRAASFTRFSRSAPEKPGVLRASTDRSTAGPRGGRRGGGAGGMDLEDGLPALQIRDGHHHLAVKPARPQQRRIQDIRPVGGGNENDALVGREAVHFPH